MSTPEFALFFSVRFDTFLVHGLGAVYAFTLFFWPAHPIVQCALFMIPIELALIVSKLFLGSRVPHAL